MADVDERRIVVGRPGLGFPLERDRAEGEAAVAGREGAREAAARPELRHGPGREWEVPRDVDGAQLLREALDPAARQGEVAVDPDVRAGRHRFAVQQRVHDDEELPILASNRVVQLRPGVGAGLPVDEQGGCAARVRVGLEARRQQGRDGVRVGPVLEHEEVADVVPRRRRHERGAALRRARDGVAAQHQS